MFQGDYRKLVVIICNETVQTTAQRGTLMETFRNREDLSKLDSFLFNDYDLYLKAPFLILVDVANHNEITPVTASHRKQIIKTRII